MPVFSRSSEMIDHVAVPVLLDRHRAPCRSVGQTGKQVVEAQTGRRRRGQHRRTDERAGQRHTAHLLQHDHHLQEAGARSPVVGRHQQAVPPEVDDPRAQFRRELTVAVGGGPHRSTVDVLGQERAGRLLQRPLVVVERELHGPDDT